MPNNPVVNKQSGVPTVFTGARAIIYINGQNVGLFSNCSWSVRQQKVPAFILGRYNPADIIPISQEPVEMRLTGFRVVGAGPYQVAGATHLQDLLQNESYFQVVVVDRRTGAKVFTANECRVQGWNSGVQARGVSDITLDIIGVSGWDESVTDDGDSNGAANLTDGS